MSRVPVCCYFIASVVVGGPVIEIEMRALTGSAHGEKSAKLAEIATLREMTRDEEDRLGYHKPPRAGGFRKGGIGNPGGRPKRRRTATRLLVLPSRASK